MVNRIRFASILLAATLVPAGATLASNDGAATPPASPPVTPPADAPTTPPAKERGAKRDASGGKQGTPEDGGALRGPRVPDGASQGNGRFDGPERGGQQRPGMRNMDVEIRAWLQSLEEISSTLSVEQKAKIKSIRDEWKAESDKWSTANGERMRALRTQLAGIRRDGGTPDKAVTEEMRKLMESRPKFEPYRERIIGVLDPTQAAAHKAAFEKVRKEMSNQSRRFRDSTCCTVTS